MSRAGHAPEGPADKLLILITGVGRSGTSTLAGALHHLGLSVPGPYLGANASNPKGFYESRWSAEFHAGLARRAGVNIFDSRPDALARVSEAISPADRKALRKFLRRFTDERVVVIKDPRSVWTQAMWRQSAERVGRGIRTVSLLRHPAEVVGSRVTHYFGDQDEDERARYELFTLTRWINNSLVNERETRGFQRAFVRYDALLEDWRPVTEELNDRWGLDLDFGAAGAVNDFIDPALSRHSTRWADLAVPPYVADIAETIWALLQPLAEGRGVDEAASAGLDGQASEFLRLLRDSSAISHDVIAEARRTTQRQSPPSEPATAVPGKRRGRIRRRVGW